MRLKKPLLSILGNWPLENSYLHWPPAWSGSSWSFALSAKYENLMRRCRQGEGRLSRGIWDPGANCIVLPVAYQKETRGNRWLSVWSLGEAFLILELDHLSVNKDGHVLYSLLGKQFSLDKMGKICLFVYWFLFYEGSLGEMTAGSFAVGSPCHCKPFSVVQDGLLNLQSRPQEV